MVPNQVFHVLTQYLSGDECGGPDADQKKCQREQGHSCLERARIKNIHVHEFSFEIVVLLVQMRLG